MIPKKIHYCWFGGTPLPKKFRKYIESWKKYCPDYEIIEWNESNFDINKYQYSREAYDNKKWAFVSDVARLEIIYTQGGIYLDTDVELIKSLDPLLALNCFIAAEDNYDLNTGIGFGAQKGNPIIYENLKEYANLSLFKFGKLNEIVCVELTTNVLRRHGYRNAKKTGEYSGVTVFPSDFFSPINITSNKMRITENTYAIHHFSATWKNNSFATSQFKRKLVGMKKYIRRNLDNTFGEGTYSNIKIRLKKIKRVTT